MNNLKVLLIILLFSINKISAQEIEWQNLIGGSGADELKYVSTTADGGYIIGARSLSGISGDKTENCKGGWDYWVLKLDGYSNIEWQNTIGGAGFDELGSVSQTSDGGYIIAGFSDSNISGDKTENNQGATDFWVVKLDATGGIQWQNTIGGGLIESSSYITQTSDGGYMLAGTSTSGYSGDKTEFSNGAADYWVIKLDSIGLIQWQNTIGGNNDDVLNSFSLTSDGGYIFGGRSDSNISGDKTENCIGGSDYWIVKSDSLGIIQWQNTIGGNYSDELYYVSQSYDGGYLLSGRSDSNISGDKTEDTNGGYDCWIIKLDTLGEIQWQNSIGGIYSEIMYSATPTIDGGSIIAGFSVSNISGDKTENNQGGTDFWVVKLDSTGEIQWQNTIGGSSNDIIRSISASTNGGYIIGGHSFSNISGDKTENSQGDMDCWILKLTDNFNLIQGVEYADLNNNTIQDIGEPKLGHQRVIESGTGRTAFTDNNGYYSLVVLDSGNFQVVPDLIPNFYNSSPANYSINFSSIFQIDSLNDFAFQPTGSYDDICISISPTGNFRAGMNASYMLSYSNVGTTSIPNATVVFYPDTNVIYVAASIVPLNISSDSVVYSIGSLSPFQTGQIIVTVNVDSVLPNGTLIKSSVAILPITGDVNPGCNMAYWEVLTTGSYDPNDILVNRNVLYDYEISTGPDLEYIIRFQNTGNDTAFNVKVLNPIDTTRLQLNTLEIVNTSHPASISWIPWERNMQFQFDNILLPDSNVNEVLSHGFIRYKIKPKTNLLVGDSINNMAAIYFDFNNPVLTNTANTDIILFTGIHETGSSLNIFNVYPNPASTFLNIQFEPGTQKSSSLELYNVFGQKLQSIEATIAPGNDFIKTIDISYLARGVYFLRLEGESSFVSKFMKY